MLVTHKIAWDKCLSHQLMPAIEKGWIPIYGKGSFKNPQGEIIGHKNIYTGGFKSVEKIVDLF